jgi:hypothetical protein
MKLASAMVERTLSQFDARPIPDAHPAAAELSRLFGNHTFFLDGNGLNIVEPTEPPEAGLQAGQVVKVASWNDAAHTSLAPHEPEPTEIVVVLGGDQH